MYVIKAVYPHGGHVIRSDDGTHRYPTQQEALDRAEVMNANERMMAARNMRRPDMSYIVVEETV